MEFYSSCFPALVLFNIALYLHRRQKRLGEAASAAAARPLGHERTAISKFKREYFTPYAFVVAADWLQGPYMYTLYKDEKGIAEPTVAALFTTGFVSAGIAASFVGHLADRYGRKAACLTCCATYSLACLSVLSENKSILFAGRALGGVSTTLQYSVFESWMVSEFHHRGLSNDLVLGDFFSSAVVLSNILAIAAGILGEGLVRSTGTKTSPFLAAVACLAGALALISNTWPENFAKNADEKTADQDVEKSSRTTLSDLKILALCFNTTVFEGSMYLFVFFWSPALISARNESGGSAPLPFGLIFSDFMCSMMLGSQMFSLLKPDGYRQAARLMLSTLALATYAFLVPVLQNGETPTFWAFALFEACAGLYFPTMSQLKSELVENDVRAKVYSLMRLPLNVFVVVALGTTTEGNTHRAYVFTAVGGIMLIAFAVVQRHLL